MDYGVAENGTLLTFIYSKHMNHVGLTVLNKLGQSGLWISVYFSTMLGD